MRKSRLKVEATLKVQQATRGWVTLVPEPRASEVENRWLCARAGACITVQRSFMVTREHTQRASFKNKITQTIRNTAVHVLARTRNDILAEVGYIITAKQSVALNTLNSLATFLLFVSASKVDHGCDSRDCGQRNDRQPSQSHRRLCRPRPANRVQVVCLLPFPRPLPPPLPLPLLIYPTHTF